MRLNKEAEDFFKKYIETPSISGVDNSEIVKLLDSYFSENRWQTIIIESGRYPELKNFVARLTPAEHWNCGDLVFTGHLDTIAPVAEDWDNKSPFSLRYCDGVYFGNGVADTKGPTVAAIMAAAEICDPKSLKRPVSFWLDHSEENKIDGLTYKGASEMVQWVKGQALTVDAMIVIEPTNLIAINAHKGLSEVVIETVGKAAHSSIPEKGINAIELMFEVVVKLENLRDQLRRDYDLPMNIGFIEGGRENQTNVVAEDCKLILDFRCPPNSITAEDVLSKINASVRGTGAKTRFRLEPVPAVYCDPDKEIIKIVSEVSGCAPEQVPYCSDAAAYKNLFDRGQLKDGMCIFGCGDIKYAHAANEQIEAEDMVRGIEYFKKIIRKYSMNQ